MTKKVSCIVKDGDEVVKMKSIYMHQGKVKVTEFEPTGKEGYGKWKIPEGSAPRDPTPDEKKLFKSSQK